MVAKKVSGTNKSIFWCSVSIGLFLFCIVGNSDAAMQKFPSIHTWLVLMVVFMMLMLVSLIMKRLTKSKKAQDKLSYGFLLCGLPLMPVCIYGLTIVYSDEY